jgi:hypothetical protein
MQPGDAVEIAVQIRYSGAQDEGEVVQLYVQQSEDGRTIQELVGLQRFFILTGARRIVIFSLQSDQLGQVGKQLRYLVQPQIVNVAVGRSFAACPLSGQFIITGEAVDFTN